MQNLDTKKRIETEAHAAAKSCFGSSFYKGDTYESIFAAQLKRLTSEAETVARVAVQTPAERIQIALTCIENKNYLTAADYTHMSELRNQMAQVA